jgi:hypothetical protein
LLLLPAPLLKAAELVTFWLEGLDTATDRDFSMLLCGLISLEQLTGA